MKSSTLLSIIFFHLFTFPEASSNRFSNQDLFIREIGYNAILYDEAPAANVTEAVSSEFVPRTRSQDFVAVGQQACFGSLHEF